MRIAADPNGDVVVIGHFDGTVDLGGGPLRSSERGGDLFVARFDPDGRHLWSRSVLGTWYEELVVDAAGNTVLAGRAGYKGVDLGEGAPSGEPGIWVAKLDAAGRLSWQWRFPGGQEQILGGLDVGPQGSIRLVAHLYDQADVGSREIVLVGLAP